MNDYMYALYHAEHEGFLKVFVDSLLDAHFVGWEFCSSIDDNPFSNEDGFFKTRMIDADRSLSDFFTRMNIGNKEDMFLVPCINGDFDFGLSLNLAEIIVGGS